MWPTADAAPLLYILLFCSISYLQQGARGVARQQFQLFLFHYTAGMLIPAVEGCAATACNFRVIALDGDSGRCVTSFARSFLSQRFRSHYILRKENLEGMLESCLCRTDRSRWNFCFTEKQSISEWTFSGSSHFDQMSSENLSFWENSLAISKRRVRRQRVITTCIAPWLDRCLRPIPQSSSYLSFILSAQSETIPHRKTHSDAPF